MKCLGIEGTEVKTDCIGCSINEGKIKTINRIFETENFTVEQDFEIPIPGFMIISSKRHIKGIENLTPKERIEFINLLFKVRKAMASVLETDYIYIIQKEDSIIRKSHFHFWLFPQYNWMLEKFGGKVSSLSPIIEYAKKEMKTKDNISTVKNTAEKIHKALIKVKP